MTTPTLLVPDFSEWQGEVNWGALVSGGYPAAIVRVYNGSRADHQYSRNRAQAHGHRVRALGLYSFLLPGGAGAIEQQAAEFVDLVGSLLPGEWVIVDYEANGLHPDMLTAWISYVGKHLHGSEPWLYGSEYVFRTEGLAADVPAVRTWLAAYGQSEPREAHELWQYTDHRAIPGVTGFADCSTFHGTVEQLLAAVGYAPAPTPGPTTHPRFPYPVGIKPGSSDPSARPLQEALKRTGWMAHDIAESDHYGPATEQGVAGFNDKHHLNAAGTQHDPAIGPRGWALLMTLAYGTH
ncbi:glycoside hydrolase family 25 protein (plasmid) [Streptomyces sp. NBC_01136]|uniref:GH25 family lysozyme n=1 Tax=Streptomyces sp. NBC_01136 TaxID=2903754 RepID=UPI0037DD38DD|nr:glycoside hydrolase family 25 protein [Streptomyces sp. NBC_01136]